METQKLVIIGGGGHTRALLGMLEPHRIKGIVTSDARLVGQMILDIPVLALEADMDFATDRVLLVNGVGNKPSRQGSGMQPRIDLFERYRAKGFEFPVLISPHAFVARGVSVAAGVQAMPGAVVQAGAVLGENVIINTRASVDHDVVIGTHCHVAPGAVICGEVQVGSHVHIGAGAVVIQGVRIGSHAVIGAGAVVTRDVPDHAVILPAASTQLPVVL